MIGNREREQTHQTHQTHKDTKRHSVVAVLRRWDASRIIHLYYDDFVPQANAGITAGLLAYCKDAVSVIHLAQILQFASPTACAHRIAGQDAILMPHSFPTSAHLQEWWGGRPRPLPAPWPAHRRRQVFDSLKKERDGGVPRGPGGPPHHLCRAPISRKLCGIKMASCGRMASGPHKNHQKADYESDYQSIARCHLNAA